jgi:archaellum component FlaC
MSDVDKEDQVSKKINEFGKILQNFGLNLIQSIGQMKHNLSILTDKIDKIEDELIEIKGIKHQLQESDRHRKEILDEIVKVNGFIKNVSSKMNSNSGNNGVFQKITKEYDSPVALLNDLKEMVKDCTNISDLRTSMKDAKEKLFVLTGGHKILFELRELDRKLKPTSDIEEDGLREFITKKIDEWILQF